MHFHTRCATGCRTAVRLASPASGTMARSRIANCVPLALTNADVKRLWAGTDRGLIHVSFDGGLHCKAVAPYQLVPFAKVSILDAGHFDVQTASAAINTLRLDDMRPHISRMHDGGKNWAEI